MTTFNEYDSFDGLGLANLVRQRVVSPAELLEAAIERTELYNPTLNAVIHKMYDQARASINGDIPAGLFQGVPFLLKDLIAEYQGAQLSFGSHFATNYVSGEDSELVKRYKQAGLIVFGKTNTPEFGLSPTTESKLFGPTKNPWDLTRTAGGSSGGSAVAVASRIVPMAHGGDGAGSLRIPAAYCGVFGFKPSRGRSPTGPKLSRLWLGMIVEHVLTRSVRDSAAMLDVIAGAELGSPIALPKPEQSFLSALEDRTRRLRIAVTDQPFFNGQTKAEYSDAVKEAGLLCQQLGHQVESVTLKINREDVLRAFSIVLLAEMTTDINEIARWMKKKVHYRDFEISTAVAYRAGKCYTAADFDWAVYTLDAAAKQMAEYFQRFDVLMTPTMIGPPHELGYLKPTPVEKMALELMLYAPRGPWIGKMIQHGAKKNFAQTSFTLLFNVTGQPAMSVPLYWDKQGLPIGIQFVGRFAEDAALLQLAQQLEEAQSWTQKKPVLTF